jgi:hypothetical protein
LGGVGLGGIWLNRAARRSMSCCSLSAAAASAEKAHRDPTSAHSVATKIAAAIHREILHGRLATELDVPGMGIFRGR